MGETSDVLLIHGWEGHYTQFASFIRLLLSQKRGITVIEMPGHGRHRGQTSNPLVFSAEIHEADTLAGPFTHLIRHSQGAIGVLHGITKRVTAIRIVLIASLPSIREHLEKVAA